MTRQDNPIHQVLKEILVPLGFSRKGDSWYHRSTEVVQVVNLQKSQYGNQYYLNYGAWLLTLSDSAFPREEKCHVRLRIEDISDAEEQYKNLLNLESDMGAEWRMASLREAFSSDLLPFIRRTGTIANVQRLYVEGELKRGIVHIDAKRLFDKAPSSHE